MKLTSFRINENYVLERNGYIRRTIEDLKNVNLLALPNHGIEYIKTKIRTYGEKLLLIFKIKE